ncbi:hypothetical protein MY3296_008380 [Beauveria thailandica]
MSAGSGQNSLEPSGLCRKLLKPDFHYSPAGAPGGVSCQRLRPPEGILATSTPKYVLAPHTYRPAPAAMLLLVLVC